MNDRTPLLVCNEGTAVTTISSEFSLRVHKALQNAGHSDLYTIGMWEGVSDLRGICYARPLDDALAVLRNVLEQAGKLAEVEQDRNAILDRRRR